MNHLRFSVATALLAGLAWMASGWPAATQPQIVPGPPLRRGGTSGFDTICVDAANADACLSRNAANVMQLNGGDDLSLVAAQITAGSGTGVTVDSVGYLRQQVYKVTVARTQFTSAALTHDVTLATLPAKTFLVHMLADLTTTFACSVTCTSTTLSMTAGSAAGGTQYLLSFDADAATGRFGDAAAELGASLAEATIPTAIGSLGSWTATTTVSARLISGTGNVGTGAATNLSQGTVVFYLTTILMP